MTTDVRGAVDGWEVFQAGGCVERFVVSRNVLLPNRPDLAWAAIGMTGTRIEVVAVACDGNASLSGLKARFSDAQFVDLGRDFVTPALVDYHTHLPLGVMRHCAHQFGRGGQRLVEDAFFRVEQAMTPEDVRAFARLGALEAMAAGVGFVWEHYYHGESLAEALCDVGLAGCVAPTAQDGAGPFRHAWEAALTATVAIDGSERLANAGIFAALGPHATDTVSDALAARVRSVADAQRLPVHMHLAQSAHERAACQARRGLAPPLWAAERFDVNTLLLAHGLYASADELAACAGAALALCPHSQSLFAWPQSLRRVHEAGLNCVVGTDGAASNDGMAPLREARSLAVLQRQAWANRYDPASATDEASAQEQAFRKAAGVPMIDALPDPVALWGAVSDAGAHLHPKVDVGAIRVGALANLACWSWDAPVFWPGGHDAMRLQAALTFGCAETALRALWVAGVRRDPAAWRSSDYAAVRKEADESLRALRQRLPPEVAALLGGGTP